MELRSEPRHSWLAGRRQLARMHTKGSLKAFVGIGDLEVLVRVVRNALLGKDFLSAMLTLMVMVMPQLMNVHLMHVHLMILKTPLNPNDLKCESLGE